jgi:cytochrome P450 family 6
MDPVLLFGNISDLFLFKTSFSDCFINLYEKFKSYKFIGCYFTYKPILLVNDPELIQDILVRDFNSFTDRPRFVDEKRDPISGHLFNIGGQKWRDLRFKLTPTFSTSKLKGMFPIMKNSGRILQEFLIGKNLHDKSQNLFFNFNDLLAKYTTNIIVAVIFSQESDCLNDPDNVFRKISATFSQSSKKQHIIDIFSFLIPNILHFLSRFNFKAVTPKVNDFMIAYVRRAIEYREETNCTRNDFLQLLIQLKNQGYITAKGKEDVHAKTQESGDGDRQKSVKKLTIEEIAGQVHVFFVGGEFIFELQKKKFIF